MRIKKITRCSEDGCHKLIAGDIMRKHWYHSHGIIDPSETILSKGYYETFDWY